MVAIQNSQACDGSSPPRKRYREGEKCLQAQEGKPGVPLCPGYRDAREQAGHWQPFAVLLHRCMFALWIINSHKDILRPDSAAGGLSMGGT